MECKIKNRIKKRIGKDLAFRWLITTNGEEIPLEGRKLTLEIKNKLGNVVELDYTTDGAYIMFCFRGVKQKTLGEHIVTLWENKGMNGQTAVDAMAVELVQYSWQETKQETNE